MHDHPCSHPHQPAGSGGGVLVLAAVLALLVLAAPQAHTLRPVVDQLRRAGPLPSVALPIPPRASGGGSGGVCPVRGRVRIGQGWGAPRDGGRRRHQGIDLLAPAGTPLVAVADGTITRASNRERGLGGISLWLRDRRGTSYYYAHNQRNLAHPGQRVRRGHIIALLGATGNARGGPPHLHFQLHPGGGPPVNPDATVRRWC
jgi:murein DD-endopeptidase MepM/ murein hydrolase activator NlpD